MKTRNIPNLAAAPAINGRLIIDTYRGQVRIRSWPRTNNQKNNPKQKAQRAWFALAREMAKYAEPHQVDQAIKTTKRTGLYPSDLIMMAMAGNLYPEIVTDDGVFTKWQPRIDPVMFQGFRLSRTSALNIAAGTPTNIPWQQANLQTVGFWNVSNPTVITVPAGVTEMIFYAGVRATMSATNLCRLFIQSTAQGLLAENDNRPQNAIGLNVTSGPIAVTPGDTIFTPIITSSASQVQTNPATFFSGMIVGAT